MFNRKTDDNMRLFELEDDLKEYGNAFAEFMDSALKSTVTKQLSHGRLFDAAPLDRVIEGLPAGRLLDGEPTERENLFEYWRDERNALLCIKSYAEGGEEIHTFVRRERGERDTKYFEYAGTELLSVMLTVKDDWQYTKSKYYRGRQSGYSCRYAYDELTGRVTDIYRTDYLYDADGDPEKTTESRIKIAYRDDNGSTPESIEQTFDNGEIKRLL